MTESAYSTGHLVSKYVYFTCTLEFHGLWIAFPRKYFHNCKTFCARVHRRADSRMQHFLHSAVCSARQTDRQTDRDSQLYSLCQHKTWTEKCSWLLSLILQREKSINEKDYTYIWALHLANLHYGNKCHSLYFATFSYRIFYCPVCIFHFKYDSVCMLNVQYGSECMFNVQWGFVYIFNIQWGSVCIFYVQWGFICILHIRWGSLSIFMSSRVPCVHYISGEVP
jgi:hypothetical protein